MRGTYEVGFWICGVIAVGLAVLGLILRKPNEYFDGPRLRPLAIGMMVFLALAIALGFLMAVS